MERDVTGHARDLQHLRKVLPSSRERSVRTMAAHWDFFPEQSGRWRWRCYQDDGSYVDSQETFQSLVACRADAMRHGYLVGEPGCDPVDNITLDNG